MNVVRHPQNPLIRPTDVKPSRPDFRVVCVFNCGVVRHNGEIVLLMRVAETPIHEDEESVAVPVYSEPDGDIRVLTFRRDDPQVDLRDSRFVLVGEHRYLTSISHLRVARSSDGVTFSVEEAPAMAAGNSFERFGIEDPRITLVDGRYHITYSAISDVAGVTTCLATTKEFKEFERHGVLFGPDNKDVAIFPERIGGRYYALNRPFSAEFGRRDIWISESPDLRCWGNHRVVMTTRDGMWDDGRIGSSAVPFRTDEGWLEIYHGASRNDRYCLGAALLAAEEPWRVIARGSVPLLQPEAPYEREGFFGGVVFTCGVLVEAGNVTVYYGAADESVCLASVPLSEILDSLRESGASDG